MDTSVIVGSSFPYVQIVILARFNTKDENNGLLVNYAWSLLLIVVVKA